MTRAIDIMTELPVTIDPLATVEAAVRTLEALEIRHLPVVDEEGELVGMISDRDLRGPLGAGPAGHVPRSARIVDVMNSNVTRALPDDDVTELARAMVDQRIGALPITDERGLLVGIVSYVDLLRSMINE